MKESRYILEVIKVKGKVFLIIRVFLFFILLFFVQKIGFILVHGNVNGGVGFADTFRILYHGLPLDMSMSGYLTVIPLLLLMVAVWVKGFSLRKIWDGYFIVILSVLAIITVADIVLYSYWGVHFDSGVFLYLKDPKNAFASSSVGEMVVAVLACLLFFAFYYAGYVFILRNSFLRLVPSRAKLGNLIVLLLLAGLLFIPIRGGVTVSTMNVGYAYFSERMFLNHAAINPSFNLLYSFSKSEDFASQYQFFPLEEAQTVIKQLNEQPESDSIPRLLTTDRPNIILVMLESFSQNVALDSTVAPNLCRLAKEGILFDHFYANSFRTDRGISSIMSGYPSHPTVAILKYPAKSATLPAIPKSLRKVGYENRSLYYGGDVNFANMRSFFVGACGIEDIISDKEFALKERLTKWGVPDKLLLERVSRDLAEEQPATPFLKVILTLSSHEPFDVPVDKFDVPFLNSVNYTDDCIGQFVARLKEDGLWDNTLLIFLADHAMQNYPQGLDNNDSVRFRIPMVWAGGAVKHPLVVSGYGSQNDLSATLLSQLGIDYSEYTFSKDMLNPQSRKFAFYSYMNGFSMMDSTGVFKYDNDRQKVLEHTGSAAMEKEAKSFFQTMYTDLGNR